MKTYQVAVLDDHALIPEAIKALLAEESQFHYATGFKVSSSLFAYLEDGNKIDFLLLDIQLNGEDGIEICERVKQEHPTVIIIMLSSNTQSAVVLDALKKGANGFLPKNIDFKILTDALKETLEGKTYIHKDISFISNTSKKSQFDYLPKLTRREKEVLRLILDEMTTAEIATTLHLSPSTVETHRASLFSKTGSKNVVGLIKFTIEKGLLD